MGLLASWQPADLLQEEIENLKAIIGGTMKAAIGGTMKAARNAPY
jgi:hypothetical protein